MEGVVIRHSVTNFWKEIGGFSLFFSFITKYINSISPYPSYAIGFLDIVVCGFVPSASKKNSTIPLCEIRNAACS
jgi:hypothetical protein